MRIACFHFEVCTFTGAAGGRPSWKAARLRRPLRRVRRAAILRRKPCKKPLAPSVKVGRAVSTHWWKFSKAGSLDGSMMLSWAEDGSARMKLRKKAGVSIAIGGLRGLECPER